MTGSAVSDRTSEFFLGRLILILDSLKHCSPTHEPEFSVPLLMDPCVEKKKRINVCLVSVLLLVALCVQGNMDTSPLSAPGAAPGWDLSPLAMALGELGAAGSKHTGQGQGQLPRVCSSSSQMTFSCPTTAAPRVFICHQESSLFPSKHHLELQSGLLQALTFHDNNLFSCRGPGSAGAVFRSNLRERCLCCADSTDAKHAPVAYE